MVIGTSRPYRRLRALWRALLGMLDSASGQALRRALFANAASAERGFIVGLCVAIAVLGSICLVRQVVALVWGV